MQRETNPLQYLL